MLFNFIVISLIRVPMRSVAGLIIGFMMLTGFAYKYTLHSLAEKNKNKNKMKRTYEVLVVPNFLYSTLTQN